MIWHLLLTGVLLLGAWALAAVVILATVCQEDRP